MHHKQIFSVLLGMLVCSPALAQEGSDEPPHPWTATTCLIKDDGGRHLVCNGIARSHDTCRSSLRTGVIAAGPRRCQ